MDFLQRTELLIGKAKLTKLRDAKVAVCGLGGVGSAACEALARAGVGKLRLIDFDKVDITNLNRQLLATRETIGLAKIQAMAERIALINPECELELCQDLIGPDNVSDLLNGLDFVVDAIDNVTGKALAINAVTDSPYT